MYILTGPMPEKNFKKAIQTRNYLGNCIMWKRNWLHALNAASRRGVVCTTRVTKGLLMRRYRSVWRDEMMEVSQSSDAYVG